MKETIKVTQADIREACFRRDADDYDEICECPIAQAIQRTHPEASVTATFVLLGGGRVQLPLEAQEFIARFDHEQPVEPFEFEIEV